MPAEEDGTGAGHGVGEPGGLCHRELQVLGCQPVDQRRRLVERADDDDRAVVAPARSRDVGAREPRQMRRHRLGHPVRERPVVGDQDRLRVAVVLGLGEQVRSDPLRLVGAIRDHQDLRRARDHVDADGAEDQALGGGDVGVAGAHDLVHRRDTLGAVGERGHRLCPADAVDFGDAGDLRGSHHCRVERAVRRRHRHGDARNARDPRRDRVHQHGAGIGGGAAGHVEPDRIQRAPAGAEPHACLVVVVEARRHQAGVEGLDPFGRLHKRAMHGLRRSGGLRGRLVRRKLDRVRCERDAVEARCVVEQRRIPALAHPFDDGSGLAVDVFRDAAPRLLQGVEGGGEARARAIQPVRHSPPRRSARSRPEARRPGS